MKTKYSLMSAASALALCILTAQAQAAGFYIQEQSVSGLGSAFSGSTTNLNDPSTIYFNPAGMTRLDGHQAQLGAHLLLPYSDLKDTGSTVPALGTPIAGGNGGNPYDPSPVPNAFISSQLHDQVWLGLSITAPFGLANEYDGGWFGRYDSIKTELKVIDIQPSVAFKVNDWISLGFGLNVQHADAELTSAVSATAGGAVEGVSYLKGSDWTAGYTAGLQIMPRPDTTIGLSYRSAISHTLDGSLAVEGAGATVDFDVKGHAALELPDIATMGVAHDLNERLTLQGQATWFGWNKFERIQAYTDEAFTIPAAGLAFDPGNSVSNIIQNYQATWALAVGAEYLYSDEWTLRGGIQFDQTPTTDEYRTSRTPDGDRTWFSGGATYQISENMALDLAATYIFIKDEQINVTRNNSFNAALGSTVSADTDGSVGIVAAGFTYKF